jgi:hypothetical protein
MSEDKDPKCVALAEHLKVPYETISDVYGEEGDTFESEDAPGEYRVLTESERETAADEALESYIDDCILPGVPAVCRNYFDSKRWKRDTLLSDGYGHTLSSYDGEEHEVTVDGEWYYIYRTN